MRKIIFLKAESTDLDNIFAVFKSAIKNMEQQGLFQWDDIYPDRNTIENDILNQQLYVGRIDERIASIFVVNNLCDPEYDLGKWQYPHSRYCIIHRLCVNPEFQNCGIGTFTVKYIEDFVKEKGVESIRLDCFAQNQVACRMYERLGYNKVGVVEFRKGKFYLMEKSLLSLNTAK